MVPKEDSGQGVQATEVFFLFPPMETLRSSTGRSRGALIVLSRTLSRRSTCRCQNSGRSSGIALRRLKSVGRLGMCDKIINQTSLGRRSQGVEMGGGDIDVT